MPKLWNETIDAHRHAVREAILDATAHLVEASGLRSVTMSQIAEQAGIGRATLYKYFADLEAVLLAWHEHQITQHLHHLAEVRDRAGTTGGRLNAVLRSYAAIAQQRHGGELATLLHQGNHVAHAERHLAEMVEALVAEGARAGDLRDDVPAAELAQYCLHALTAAAGLTSQAAVNRLVDVTLSGMRPLLPPTAEAPS